MIVQLPNGNTMQMTLDKYLSIDDDEFNELIWKTTGSDIQDPFYDSTLKSGDPLEDSEVDDEYVLISCPEINEELIELKEEI